MQYHARALAESGVDVDLVGYKGAPLPKFVTDASAHRRASARRGAVARTRPARDRRSSTACLPSLDAVRASCRLLGALMRIPRPDLVLVQKPPAFPTLQVAWLVSRLRGARFVLDWHNLGYSILALQARPLASGGAAGALVRAAPGRRRARAPVRVARLRAFLAEPFRDPRCARALRPAGVGLRAGRADRARADSAGAVLAARRSAEPAPSGSSCARRAGPRTRTSTS